MNRGLANKFHRVAVFVLCVGLGVLVAFVPQSAFAFAGGLAGGSSLSKSIVDPLIAVDFRLYRHVHKKKKKSVRKRVVKKRIKKRLRKRRVARKRIRQPNKQVAKSWIPANQDKDPIQLVVSLPEQKMTVYQGDKVLTTSRISSGKPGYDTPAGVFTILHKNRHHRSNIYSGAPMPYMQRLTWSGIALHESNSVPNRPASHGCVRLPGGFAAQLFKFTESGVHVVVANEKTVPVDISHPLLFNSSTEEVAAKPVQVASIASAADLASDATSDGPPAPYRMLITRWTRWHKTMEVQQVLHQLGHYRSDLDGLVGPATIEAIKWFKREKGLPNTPEMSDAFINTLFASVGRERPANGRLYIRRNFTHLMEFPVTISGEGHLGTHVFTAMHFNKGDQNVRWRAVSLTKGTGRWKRDKAHAKASSAKEALDRIEIDPKWRRQIEAILTPGTSVSITNDGISRETMPKGSDFIMLMQ